MCTPKDVKLQKERVVFQLISCCQRMHKSWSVFPLIFSVQLKRLKIDDQESHQLNASETQRSSCCFRRTFETKIVKSSWLVVIQTWNEQHDSVNRLDRKKVSRLKCIHWWWPVLPVYLKGLMLLGITLEYTWPKFVRLHRLDIIFLCLDHLLGHLRLQEPCLLHPFLKACQWHIIHVNERSVE